MIKDIKADKSFQAILANCQFDEARMHRFADAAAEVWKSQFQQDIAAQLAGQSLFIDGVHNSVGKDAKRGFVGAVNGEPCARNAEDAPRKLAAALPDTKGAEAGPANPGWKMRSFVSMMCCQSGIGGQIVSQHVLAPSYEASANKGLMEYYRGQCSDITVGGGKVVIETRVPVNIKANGPLRINGKAYDLRSPASEMPHVTGYSYKLTIEAPLGQQPAAGDEPVFTARVERGPHVDLDPL
ncbi:MAG: hypothetical protein HUK26_06970 [Duodenibacillus sp.]|nr:hypothetical protein [Duodenibacillus sp.]